MQTNIINKIKYLMNYPIMKSHVIIITDNIISDIENIITIPEEYKNTLKKLLLSNDKHNITLAEEIIHTLSPTRKFVFISYSNFNTAIGYQALYNNISGNNNIVIGKKYI